MLQIVCIDRKHPSRGKKNYFLIPLGAEASNELQSLDLVIDGRRVNLLPCAFKFTQLKPMIKIQRLGIGISLKFL